MALFGAFCGLFTSPSPCPGCSAASVSAPSGDTIAELSFVESSRTESESCPPSGLEVSSAIGSLLCPSSRPPASPSHCSSVTWGSPSATWGSPSAIWHLPSAIWHLPSAISSCPFPNPNSEFPVPSSTFRIPHFLQHVERPQQLPRLGRLVPPVPLEPQAAIQRRAVGPIGVFDRFDGLVPGQQLLEPALVPIDDHGECPPRLGLGAGSGSDLMPAQPVVEGGIARRPFFPEFLPFHRGIFRDQHVPGHEDGIERRVVDRLDNLLPLEPDEPEQDRHFPLGPAVQQDAEFGLALQQPAAALGGGFELADEQPRVVVPERLPFDLDLFRRGDVQQPAAELLNLLEPPRVEFLGPLARGRANPLGHVGRLGALSAVDGQRQPRRPAGQF